MRKLPIPFSDPMVAAILAGRKTQTRRILDPQPFADGYFDSEVFCDWVPAPASNQRAYARFSAGAVGGGAVRTEVIEPRYAIGDLLWVRETYYQFGHWEPMPGAWTKGGKQKWAFVRDSNEVRFEPPPSFNKAMPRHARTSPAIYKRLGRFMPRSASRITLRVTGVKVERLQDISEADAKAEGAPGWNDIDFPNEVEATAKEHFRLLWKAINGPDSWARNDWVAAYSFEPIFQNIDKIAAEKEPTPC